MDVTSVRAGRICSMFLPVMELKKLRKESYQTYRVVSKQFWIKSADVNFAETGLLRAACTHDHSMQPQIILA